MVDGKTVALKLPAQVLLTLAMRAAQNKSGALRQAAAWSRSHECDRGGLG